MISGSAAVTLAREIWCSLRRNSDLPLEVLVLRTLTSIFSLLPIYERRAARLGLNLAN